MGRPGVYSGALRGRCADLHSRRAQGTQVYHRTEAPAAVPKGLSTEGDRLGTSQVSVLQLEDGATQLLKRIRLRLGGDLQQDVSETQQTFPSPFRASVSVVDAALHCRGIEPERTVQAVKCVSTPGKDEPETKEIIADVLRGFLLLENAARTGSEQVFVFGVACKSYAYNHTANALRETWDADDRLRSHDIALSQQLQGGHLAGGVHWTGEEVDWQETDYEYEDSLEPWTSEWYNTDGYDDETHLEETHWTEDFYETDDHDPNDSTFSDRHPALLDQTVETQEGDTSKLDTVPEAAAAANAAADMRRRTRTQARQFMKDVHRSRGYFPVSKGNKMEVDQGKGKSRGKKGRSSKGKGKHQGKSKGKCKGRRPEPCLLCQGPHCSRDSPSHHGGKGKRVNSFGKGHKNSSPFRQAYLEGDKHDWITGAGAFAVSVPSFVEFCQF